MDDKELIELYKNIKRGYDNSNWDTIQETLEYILEFVDVDDEELSEENI